MPTGSGGKAKAPIAPILPAAGGPVEQRRAGVLVPARALSEEGDRTIAWIVNQGRAERRAVAVGTRQDDDVLVTAGLDGGERVILNAPAELVDGMPVTELN